MENAIPEGIHDRFLRTVRFVHGNASSLTGVEFRTTVKTRMRRLRTAPRVSETREREMVCVFSDAHCGYNPEGGGDPEVSVGVVLEEGYIPLPPVRISPRAASPSNKPPSYKPSSLPQCPFVDRLIKIHTRILAQRIVPCPRSLPPIIPDTPASSSVCST